MRHYEFNLVNEEPEDLPKALSTNMEHQTTRGSKRKFYLEAPQPSTSQEDVSNYSTTTAITPTSNTNTKRQRSERTGKKKIFLETPTIEELEETEAIIDKMFT